MGPTCQSNSTLSSFIFCSCNYWTEHLWPPPSSELRQAPTSSPIVAGRRCPCPWLHRSSHAQRLASAPSRPRPQPPISTSVSGRRARPWSPAIPAPTRIHRISPRAALDELAHGRRRQSRQARKRSDSLHPWPRPSTCEEEDAEPLARAVL
jgi:hypothetical protein